MFAANLKRIRKEKNMSQCMLGEKIGKTQQMISWYESGKVSPSIKVIDDIARVLKISVNELLQDH